jgi:16S rRNA (cytosine1402-N4)-methyltransferase
MKKSVRFLSVQHNPVLLDEVISVFRNPVKERKVLQQQQQKLPKIYFDGTVGAAGHFVKVLRNFPSLELAIGLDQDQDSLRIAKENLNREFQNLKGMFDKIKLVHSNFENLPLVCEKLGIGEKSVDLMLFDVGVSSMQLDTPERGFSFMHDGPLDMRMNTNSASVLSCQELIEKSSEEDLRKIISFYGEEKYAKEIAKEIKRLSFQGELKSTQDLRQLCINVYSTKKKTHSKISPATKTFQALRIALNKELEVLDSLFEPNSIIRFAAPGAKVAFITFHSLESRIVKRGIQKWESEGLATSVSNKPIEPSEAEIEQNKRARSALLRCVQFAF